MAVNDITATNPIPTSAQQIASSKARAVSERLHANQARAAAMAQEVRPGLQNELLINQALQNLNFVPQLQTDTLLLNERSALLAANETLQNLYIIQQNTRLANQARRDSIAATAQTNTPAAAAAITTGAATAPQPTAAAAPLQAVTTAPLAATQVPAATVAAATATTPTAPTAPPAPAAATTITPPQGAIPAANPVPPAAQQIPGGTPGAAVTAPLTGANQTPAAAAVLQAPNPILQNELLINQALQNLSFVLQPPPTAPINATPAQPAAAPLQRLNAVPQTPEPQTIQAPLNVNVTPQTATPAAATAAAPGQQTVATVPQAATQVLANPILQNELLINQALQNLNFVPGTAVNPLTTITPPPLANPGTTQGNVLLQTELLINQGLQNLNFVTQPQTNTLLINETPAQVAANPALQNLTAVQQNAVQTNQALLNLNATAQATTPAAVTAATAANAAATAQQAAVTQQAAAATQQAAQTTATTVATAAATATAPPIVPLPPGAVTTVFTPTPITATFVTQGLNQVPFFLQNPDRTPYVVAVYEVRNPNPAPAEPAPIPTEVRPPMPAGTARPVGRATLRQAWANYRARAYEENIPPAAPVAERNLRHVLTQVNADMAANGLPLHLVFARNEAGYALNVYDCSDNELCRLTRDVPLKFEDTTITNLLQETGIMINTSS